jgi:hypothetical protein
MEDLCKGPAFRGQFRRPAGTPAACSGTPVAPGAEASCCCWDDSVLAKTVFRRVPLRFRLLRPLSRLLAPFGLLPRIPRQNAELTSWTLFAVDCSPPAALAPLLQHLLWVAGGHKLDGLSLVLDLRDPAAAVVARLATARVIHDVYFKYWDGRPVPPPARLLFADPRN